MVKKERSAKERKRYLTYVMKFKDDVSLDIATDSMTKLIKDIWGESLENATFQNKFFSDEKVGVISIYLHWKDRFDKENAFEKIFSRRNKIKNVQKKIC